MYTNNHQDTQARGQLRELFRGHTELLESALILQTRKEQAEHEAKEARRKAMYPPPEPGKPYIRY